MDNGYVSGYSSSEIFVVEGSDQQNQVRSGTVERLDSPKVGFGQVVIGSFAVAAIAIGIFGVLAFYNRQPFAQWSSQVTQFLNNKMQLGKLTTLGNNVVPISSIVIGGGGALTLGALVLRYVSKTRQYEKSLKENGVEIQKEGLSTRRISWAVTAFVASLIAGSLLASFLLGDKGKTAFGQWMQQNLTRYNWLPLVILPASAAATLTAIFATFKALHSQKTYSRSNSSNDGTNKDEWDPETGSKWDNPGKYIVSDEDKYIVSDEDKYIVSESDEDK